MAEVNDEQKDARKPFTLPIEWFSSKFLKAPKNLMSATIRSTIAIDNEQQRNYISELANQDKVGWMVFVENEDDAAGLIIPPKPAPIRDTKSPSERMYDVIYVKYASLGFPYGNDGAGSARFYYEEVEKHINEIKSELPPRPGYKNSHVYGDF
jgi:hypothetical protein